MSAVATTKLSSRGQVVIPEDIRERLGLKEGDQFVVIGKGDSVILKVISLPPVKAFKELIDEASKQAKKLGLKKADLDKTIKKARRRK